MRCTNTSNPPVWNWQARRFAKGRGRPEVRQEPPSATATAFSEKGSKSDGQCNSETPQNATRRNRLALIRT